MKFKYYYEAKKEETILTEETISSVPSLLEETKIIFNKIYGKDAPADLIVRTESLANQGADVSTLASKNIIKKSGNGWVLNTEVKKRFDTPELKEFKKVSFDEFLKGK
jgi:hypothetical protein